MPIRTVYSKSSDGYAYNSNAVYATARNAATGTILDAAIALEVGQVKVTNYYIFRGLLIFDTSIIPGDCTVTKAVLSVRLLQSDLSSTDFDIVVSDGQPTYPHDPLEAADYKLANYSGNGGSVNTSGISRVAYVDIELNATGLTWVQRAGTTKLALLSSRDIGNNTPTGSEEIIIYSSEGMYPPKLTITYQGETYKGPMPLHKNEV